MTDYDKPRKGWTQIPATGLLIPEVLERVCENCHWHRGFFCHGALPPFHVIELDDYCPNFLESMKKKAG